MTTAGPNSPSTVTSSRIHLSQTKGWTDPGNATSSDDNYAVLSLDPGEFSYALRCTDFGFTDTDVPPSSTIDGIVVEVEVSQDAEFVQESGTYLIFESAQLNGAVGLGDGAGNSGFTPDGADAYWPLGGPTDTASSGVTAEMIIDASFGVDLSFSLTTPDSGPSNIFVDHVRMTVYYTAGGVGYTLTADSGAFSLTGRDLALKRGRKLAVGSGSFALTGQAVALKCGYRLAVGSGSFALTGQAVTLSRGRKIGLGSGSFSLTGQALSFSRGRSIAIGSGAFALTGSALAFLRGSTLSLGSGSFVLTGQAVAFLRTKGIQVGSGAFTLTGQAVGLAWGHRLSVGSGSFALAGQALNFARGRRIVIGSGSFTLTGQALAFARTKSLRMASGSFAFTGSAVTLRYSPPLVMGTGHFILTGMRIGPFPRRPDAVRVFVPAEAPRWFTQVARSIERELRNRRLLEVGEAVDLPDAGDYRSRMVNVVGLGVVAVSNGTDWIRLDTGATL